MILKGAPMKKKIIIATVIILCLGCGIAAYFYFQHVQAKPEPQAAQVPLVVSVPAVPIPAQEIIEAPPGQPALPGLSGSDKFVLDALAGLIKNDSLMKLFFTDRIIRRIVATIDNLPRKHLPLSMMPVRRAPGTFMVEGPDSDKTISPKNAARYSAYVKIAGAMDAKTLVALYVRLYPLFQQAYVELGYPDKYFNDRLLETLDHLLAAPDLKKPVRLVRPNVFYLYADPDLEARSAGQKILMRIGDKNEAKIKAGLREIKRELLLHMREKKVAVPK